jgi:hypothetical protein
MDTTLICVLFRNASFMLSQIFRTLNDRNVALLKSLMDQELYGFSTSLLSTRPEIRAGFGIQVASVNGTGSSAYL